MARIPCRRNLLALAAVIVLAGCQEQEQIRSYTVKKELFDSSAPAGEPQRMLAVMVPRDKEAWFFKLLGPEKLVGEQVETFDRFIASVHWVMKESARYAKPEGWQELPGKLLPGSGQIVARFRPKGEGPQVELSVTTLPGAAGDARSNIDRWRGQLGLGPIGEAELKKLVGNVKVDGIEGTRIDFTGPGKKPGRAAPMGAVLPFRFASPDGWERRPPDAPKGIRRPLVFRIRDGEQMAEVSAVPLAGDGGGPLANVNRWRRQVGLAPINEEQLKKDLRQLDTADGPAPYIDLLGQGPMGPQRILGAWIAHGRSTWFITLKGEPALVGKQQAAFEAFVKSIRFADGQGAAHE